MERDFTYIDDAIDATIKVINKISKIKKNIKSKNLGAPYKIINIGAGKKIDLIKFINLIEKNLKIKAKKHYKKIQLGDVQSTLSDTSEMKSYIKFKSKVSINSGVKDLSNGIKIFMISKKKFVLSASVMLDCH